MKGALFTIFVLLLIHNSLQQISECWLFKRDPLETMSYPLFLDKDSKDPLYPLANTSYSWAAVPVGGTFIISCPGSIINVGSTSLNSTEYAVCGNDTLIYIGDISFDLDQLSCGNSIDQFSSVREDQKSCESNGTLIEIGFDIGIDDKFVTQSTVCFDNQEFLAKYAHYNITHNAIYADNPIYSAPLAVDPYYPEDLDIKNLYEIDTLRANINPLLGLDVNSSKYFNGEKTITEEILTYVPTFMYAPQQFAAFRFINAAPKWSTLHNWYSANYDIKEFVVKYDLSVEVYTGTHGVAKLPHEDTKDPVELYLYQSEETGKIIKVPEILWSVVYEPSTKRALAVVVHNNIYLHFGDIEDYCTDIYDDVQWFQWRYPHLIQYGHGYLCSYDDFRSSVPGIPEIEVNGILY